MAEIAVRQVRKTYGKQEVVHGVDLHIASGQFIVILGPSGCGKSTLLRMIAGLEEISAGEIAIDGAVVNKLEPRERGCAMVFQNYALYPHMSVRENIGYALKVAGVSKAERQARIEAVARTIGLENLLDRRPGQLSGGQRQRVAMGRAMIREPKVFLFDEPLSNLDAKLRVQMRIEIRKLHNRLKATSVFVTHDQIEAMTLADQLVVMNGGHIEQTGTPDEIYRHPATRFVAEFVGAPAMNLLDGTITARGEVTIAGQTLGVMHQQLEAGTKVSVGIRAEDVLLAAMSADGIRQAGTLTLDIDFVEELGATRLLHGQVGDEAFIVQVPAVEATNASKAGIGPLTVKVPASAIHLFDAASGLRINPIISQKAAA